MRRHLQYLKYVLRHKWFVFRAGIKLRVPLLILIFHDWDKFLPDEWFPYARTFYKPNGEKQYQPDGTGFDVAWLKHQNRNKHHWQYWMITWDKGNTECLPMPDRYRREMLADWRGAGKAITGEDNCEDWYWMNRENIKMHPETRTWIESQLDLSNHRDYSAEADEISVYIREALKIGTPLKKVLRDVEDVY
jgi:hypothetical protein